MDQPKVAIDSELDSYIPKVAVSSVGGKIRKNDPGRISLEKPEPVSFFRHITNIFFDFLESIVVALSIFVVVYLFFVQPHEVKGSSMEPSFHNNEYILTDKISYRFSEPQRGEVVIFKAPSNQEVDYIKRIIGLPGERVKISGGKVFVNDKLLDEDYLADLTYLSPSSRMQEGVNIIVPEGFYFMMGDNRPNSSDSREFGPIPAGSIVGKAFFRYWPPTQTGVIKHRNY